MEYGISSDNPYWLREVRPSCCWILREMVCYLVHAEHGKEFGIG